MRILSTAPAITETVLKLGLADQLVGISNRCSQLSSDPTVVKLLNGIPEVTGGAPQHPQSIPSEVRRVFREIGLSLETLQDAAPDTILLSSAVLRQSPELLPAVKAKLSALLGIPVEADEDETTGLSKSMISEPPLSGRRLKVANFYPLNLEEIDECFIRLGRTLGQEAQGLALAHRFRSQLLDWSRNFYERTRNKRVVCLGGVEPLTARGLWISDILRTLSCQTISSPSLEPTFLVDTNELVDFRPDLLIVAVEKLTPKECWETLRELPMWDEITAVKRGAVLFCLEPQILTVPGPGLLQGCSALLSAIAGFNPGYVGAKNYMMGIRELELRRAKK